MENGDEITCLAPATYIPKMVFIVPYRNRRDDLNYFMKQMEYVLSDMSKEDYAIFIIHQKDTRPFNRGAIKNIGFFYVKEKYPDAWRTMTFVFNDVDTTPTNKNTFNYLTTQGTIKHFYGFMFALGGIFSITGADFERLGGFPNYWAWGFEDTELNRRAILEGIHIDRSQFIYYGKTGVNQRNTEAQKKMNMAEKIKHFNKNKNGFRDLVDVKYIETGNNGVVDVVAFETGMEYDKTRDYILDTRSGKELKIGGRHYQTMVIPFLPTQSAEQKEPEKIISKQIQLANYTKKMGNKKMNMILL